MYTSVLGVTSMEDVIEFFKLAHLYQTDEIYELATSFLIKKCTSENVIQLFDMALTYENKRLRKTCKMVSL